MRGVPHPLWLRDKARELIAQGLTVREAARQLGVSKSALHEWVAGSRAVIGRLFPTDASPFMRLPAGWGPNMRFSRRFYAELDETEASLKKRFPVEYILYESTLATLSAFSKNPEEEYGKMRTSTLLSCRAVDKVFEGLELIRSRRAQRAVEGLQGRRAATMPNDGQ